MPDKESCFEFLLDGRHFLVRFDPDGRRHVQERLSDRIRRTYWRTVNQRHFRSRSLAERVLAAAPNKKAAASLAARDHWATVILPNCGLG
jgi:hypothetical protein